MFHVPNGYRVGPEKSRIFGSTPADGNNGMFIIPHYKINNYFFYIQASDGMIWKPIKGYENLYKISNFGKVRTLKKTVSMPNGAVRYHEEKELKLDNSTGYSRVLLCDQLQKQHLVHVLVAEHFIDNPNNYPIINHKDGNKLNNLAHNLEWCSKEYNIHHAIESGLKKGIKAKDIIKIKELIAQGIHDSEIAKMFNKHQNTIFDIRFGRHRNIENKEYSEYTDPPFWEHVSVSIKKLEKRVYKETNRCPTWDEMCAIKGFFWDKQDCVVQFHPPENEYVSMHHFCLHLWRPVGVELPMPQKEMVGVNLKR